MNSSIELTVRIVDIQQDGMVYISSSGRYYILISNNLSPVQRHILIKRELKKIRNVEVKKSYLLFL